MNCAGKADAVKAAMTIAQDVADGRTQVSDLEAAAANKCRELFGTVYGPKDPIWEMHCDVARQVLGMGGLTADELAEWTALQRRREGEKPAPSWIEQALADGADDDEEPALDVSL